LPLTLMFVTASLVAGAIRMMLLWASTRIAFSTGADLGIDVYRRTLYQPFHVHVARNSSEVISGIVNKVNGVVFGVLQPSLMLLSSLLLLIAIMLTLIAIDPLMALLASISFGVSYGFITWMSRHRVHRNSERIAFEQTQVVKALQEGLGGIRDVLLDGSQSVYCDIYRKADIPLRRAQGNNIFIGGSPRYIMEALGMSLIAVLAYSFNGQSGGIVSVLPVLGALALGAQRLLPALQTIYSAWTSIAGAHASLDDTIELLEQPVLEEALQPGLVPLLLQRDIRFKDVSFRYADNGPWVLEGIDLAIPKGSRVGFVGNTGGGKSTALDLLMGLLLPTKGALLLDDQHLKGDRLRSWQRSIAHVPQSIYLADASIAENIAFGVAPQDIDLDRVKEAAQQAQIGDFIENRLEGYQATVGEQGIRLSGGQRQRLGIARALYKRASVLVFDEATSALDNATEQSVMEAIKGLSGDLTILLIAHRLSTIKHCDIVVELDQGRIVAQGTYDDLLEHSASFRKMAMPA
jgi:ABC-type multidrug transport system fused ATPase/permease subunit